MNKENRIVLRLNDEQMKFIKDVAKENGISALNAVRLIIEDNSRIKRLTFPCFMRILMV